MDVDRLRFDDAGLFARAWLSVALASGKDKDRPALDRTVMLEVFERGVRLVAVDGFMLLRSWVPFESWDMEAEPELEEAPEAFAVAVDEHGRAKSLAGHIVSITSGEDALPIEMDVSLGVVEPEDDDAPSLPGLEAEWVVLEIPGSERLRLRTFDDGGFPQWRSVSGGFISQSVRAIALNPELVARVAKLERFHRGLPLLWYFGGPDSAARIEIPKAWPTVHGLVMPVRWDWDLDQPADTPEAGGDEETPDD